MINPDSKESLGRRIGDLNSIIISMKQALHGMENYRNDLLVGIATICKIDGFNDTVTPMFNDECDIVVKFHRKDVRQGVQPSERNEINFRLRTVYAMGFAYVREEQSEHDLFFFLKVK